MAWVSSVRNRRPSQFGSLGAPQGWNLRFRLMLQNLPSQLKGPSPPKKNSWWKLHGRTNAFFYSLNLAQKKVIKLFRHLASPRGAGSTSRPSSEITDDPHQGPTNDRYELPHTHTHTHQPGVTKHDSDRVTS